MTDKLNDVEIKTISILGGTGKEGKGLGYRWANAGYNIIIGSRKREKAETAATELRELCGEGKSILGLENPEAAQKCELAVLTVPFSAHVPMLESLKPYLKDKILVDVTVPLVPPKVTRVQMPLAGSAGLEAKQILGNDTFVVSAFQNIAYEHLLSDEAVQCDVLVSGEGKAVREKVLKLVSDAGMVGWDAGPLQNSVIAEGLTSILIGLNKQYGVESSGIQITGIPRPG